MLLYYYNLNRYNSLNMHSKNVLVSGITTTGNITLGNYLGAILPCLKLQENNKLYLFIANLHSLTTFINDANQAKNNLLNLAKLYLACGIDVNKTCIFVQSDVPEHSELYFLLICFSTYGDLKKMTQYKDKVKNANNTVSESMGLLTYPVLMAADILLYQPNFIPVGKDQTQHIELCRDLAIKVNKKFQNIFTIPEAYDQDKTLKIKSLVDPLKKMSKSDNNKNAFISLLDDEDIIHKKISSSLTDSFNRVKYDEKNQPGISNLIQIYSLLKNLEIKEIEKKYENIKNYKDFKNDVAQAIIEELIPIQRKYNELKDEEVIQILKSGAQQASMQAKQTLNKFKKALGLIYEEN